MNQTFNGNNQASFAQAAAVRSPDQILAEWENASRELARLRTLESSLRAEVLSTRFAEHKASGTENRDIGNGFVLKAVFKQNLNLSKADGAVEAALQKLEKSGEEGKFIASRLVKFEPKLSKTEYDKLSPKHKAIIDTVLTITDATPSIEIVAPKEKR